MLERGGKWEPSYTAAGNVSRYSPMENSMVFPLKTKLKSLQMIQKTHSFAYIQKKILFKKKHAPQCSLQHYLQ